MSAETAEVEESEDDDVVVGRDRRLPRKVRRELERATRDMTDAAQAAHAARETAERAAAAHAAQAAQAGAVATEAIQARAAAERAARTEAQRRTVAEQLASETAEHAAMANATAQAALLARTEAEESALRASLEREAAEANARAQAEAAARAEARAQELAASLEEARAALLEHTRATLAAQQAQAAAPAPVASPPAPPTPPPAVATPAPDHRIQPEGVPELVEFRSPSSSAVATVLLGAGALVAAGITVYEAYLDRLTTAPGIAAGAVTLLLVILVGRSKGSAGRVWLERGVLHVEEGDSHRRFDLSTPDTKVEMVGRPGARRWKVLFMRKGMAPYAIDSTLVDPEPFVAALEPWRPKLGR